MYYFPGSKKTSENDIYVHGRDRRRGLRGGAPPCDRRSLHALERIDHNSRTLLLAFLVMLIVFGLLFVVEIYWAWSLLIGFIAGALFWYFCTI